MGLEVLAMGCRIRPYLPKVVWAALVLLLEGHFVRAPVHLRVERYNADIPTSSIFFVCNHLDLPTYVRTSRKEMFVSVS